MRRDHARVSRIGMMRLTSTLSYSRRQTKPLICLSSLTKREDGDFAQPHADHSARLNAAKCVATYVIDIARFALTEDQDIHPESFV